MNDQYKEADFATWAKKSTWSTDETVQLIEGLEPDAELIWLVNRGKDVAEPEVSERMRRRTVEMARDEASARSASRELGITYEELSDPLSRVQKAEALGYHVPEQLARLCFRAHTPQQEARRTTQTGQDGALQSIRNTDRWRELEGKATAAFEQYPQWAKGQRRVQLSGNLQEWLKEAVGCTSRDAELIKSVLSEIFEIAPKNS